MSKLNAGKTSLFAIYAGLMVASFLVGKSLTSVYATAGTVGLGGECDVTPNDASHACSEGLVCIPQGSDKGNGKCGVVSTATPTGTPTSTPTATPTSTPTSTPCGGEFCATSTPTATPTATPEATSTPNDGDVCLNIDGVQTSVPDGLHLGADGTSCVSFSNSNPPETNGPQGQVLGASTMAGTGSFDENLYMAIAALGTVITAFGFKNFKKSI